MFCIGCIGLSDIFVAAGVIATLLGVGAALFLGVGGWRRDTRLRETESMKNQRAFATLLAHDVRRTQIQARDTRQFLEEARFGPSKADDGTPINVFLNAFAAEHAALMILSPLALLQSTEWAKHLPHDPIKLACSLSAFVTGWNEKARLLQNFPDKTTLPEDLSNELVFTLDKIEEYAARLLPLLNDLVGSETA